VHDSLFEEPKASRLEEMRLAARRLSDCITYDCYNAMYPRKGSRVRCRLGLRMGSEKDATMELNSVLAGRTGAGCRQCQKYNGDEGVFNEIDTGQWPRR